MSFKGRITAVAVVVGAVAKSSEKFLVKRFCEKNFTEFLLDLKLASIFTSSPKKVSLQGKNFEGKLSQTKMGADQNTLRFRNFPHAQVRYKNNLVFYTFQKNSEKRLISDEIRGKTV